MGAPRDRSDPRRGRSDPAARAARPRRRLARPAGAVAAAIAPSDPGGTRSSRDELRADYRQSTLRTSTGSAIPFSLSTRGSDSGKRVGPASSRTAAGDQDLLAVGGSPDARGDVHAAARIVAAVAGGLGCMEADAHPGREPVLSAMPRQATLDVHRALQPVDRPLEGHEETVAGLFHLLAPDDGRRMSAAPDRASAAASARLRRR